MKNIKFRFFLALFSLMSVLMFTFSANAAPVKFEQVVQVVNIKAGKAQTSAFAQLRLANDVVTFGDTNGDDDDEDKPTQQDDRVITETTTEIVEDSCDCEDIPPKKGFPKWALLGLAAIPIALIIIRDKKTPPPSMTPPITPPTTETPTMTPTPTPPEPVPEPMTILLFGTGLAGIGMAARRKFGKKGEKESEDKV